MRQLVGSNCAVCQQRIPSEMDAAFCKQCGNPVHTRCITPNSSADKHVCSACGSDLRLASAQQFREEQQRELAARQAPPRPPLELQRALEWYRVGRYLVGAFLVLMVGIVLLANGETGVGIGALFAGLGIGALGVLLNRR